MTDPEVLRSYGYSENSYHGSAPHAVVVKPESTEDVVKIIGVARKYRFPVTPYSGATSLEGHFAGYSTGSICLDMSGMDKILKINVEDADLVCQSGARWEDINETLKEQGIPLFFPLDPGPGAVRSIALWQIFLTDPSAHPQTIGGMVGTGCSGTNAVRYGTARSEWFLNLTVVLPNGKVIKTKRRARKSSTGFDTTKLFIGAEGTLGIVTEATLRLAPVIPSKVAMAQFPDVNHAVSAVQEVLTSPYGSHIQCVELLDDHMMAAINAGGMVSEPLPLKDSLFFKIQGAQDTVERAAETIKNIVARHGSSQFRFAATDEDAEDLWQNRKYALMSTLSASPGARCWTTDVWYVVHASACSITHLVICSVPVSKLPQLVYETKQDMAECGLKSTIVGHVGDGNFHAFMLFRNDEEFEVVKGAVHRLVHRALALDGTCTGEHGVGLGKKEYLIEELGQGTIELMLAVKKAVDPDNIMNPGKLYPDLPGARNP
ncbi:hypothetical protein FA95DRAFT_340661 [Auriscalpium vulgare]|uniref:Uncharacterized protein n=1 Tax=Auriscalpium vulgare TaxID=40419 RepID=A0ACB8RJL1_9AGAM|nr:hypothetical protein FA95DRAFT_340661 [Auriscalpium vulgare]